MRDVQLDLDRAGEGHVLVQHRRLVDEHVGPRDGEALVGGHVLLAHADADLVDERHRLGGVADVLVECVGASTAPVVVLRAIAASCRRRGGRATLPSRSFGGQASKLAPLVRAGLEDPRLRVLGLALALQVVLEERELDLLAVELGGLGVEGDVAERVAVAAAPAAVDPRAHHQEVVRGRVVRLDVP